MKQICTEGHVAMEEILKGIETLEENYPHVTPYAEEFIEILMNLFPSDNRSDTWFVNERPIIEIHK